MVNKLKYIYRIVAKLFSFLIFGIGTIFVFVFIFPFLRLSSKSYVDFQRKGRHVLYVGSALVIKIMCAIRILKVEISEDDKIKLRDAKSAIVAANHPGFFDAFLMVSLLPCTDFVVKSSLSSKNFISTLVNTFFMTNDMDFTMMVQRCRENFDAGGTLSIFPEGTRSPHVGQNQFKKGTARISILTNYPIIPVYIGGNSKVGFRKGDKVLDVNPTEKYIYTLSVKDPIYPSEFSDFPYAIAVKNMTDKLKDVLADENNFKFCYN